MRKQITRKKKTENSEVSLDGKGFPKMFAANPENSPGEREAAVQLPHDWLSGGVSIWSLWKGSSCVVLWGLGQKRNLFWERQLLWKRHRQQNQHKKKHSQIQTLGRCKETMAADQPGQCQKSGENLFDGTDPKQPCRIIVEVSAARCPGHHKSSVPNTPPPL